MTTHSLPDEVYERVAFLSRTGDELADAGRLDDAIREYVKALELLPEPVEAWSAATWLLTAIGDASFQKGDFEKARRALSDAMHCPEALGNPFIHLRLGQAQFELGNKERAKDELARAYMGGGEEVFEDEDSKYLRWVLQFLEESEPEGGT